MASARDPIDASSFDMATETSAERGRSAVSDLIHASASELRREQHGRPHQALERVAIVRVDRAARARSRRRPRACTSALAIICAAVAPLRGAGRGPGPPRPRRVRRLSSSSARSAAPFSPPLRRCISRGAENSSVIRSSVNTRRALRVAREFGRPADIERQDRERIEHRHRGQVVGHARPRPVALDARPSRRVDAAPCRRPRTARRLRRPATRCRRETPT